MTKRLENDIDDAVVVDGQSENLTDMQDDIDAELQSVLSEFGGDPHDTKIEIRIKKVEPKTGKTAHCFNAVPSELPLTERIKDEYGPGIYEVWVYKNGYRHKKTELRIAAQQKKPLDKVMAENKQDVAAIVSSMMEQQRESMRQMQEMIARQQPAIASAPATDPIAMMAGLMNAMQGMKEFIQPQQTGDNMTMFLKGIELAKDITGGGAETNFNDTVIKLGKEFLPSLINIAQTAPPTPGTPSLQRPPQPTPPGQPQLSGAQPVTETPGQDATFKMQIDMLVAQAAAGKDAGIYADLIGDNVPAEQIQAFITRPDMIEYLTQFNPLVSNHRQWFESLRSELQEILTVDTPEPEKDTSEKDLTDIEENVISSKNNEIKSGVEGVIEPDAIALDSESSQDT